MQRKNCNEKDVRRANIECNCSAEINTRYISTRENAEINGQDPTGTLSRDETRGPDNISEIHFTIRRHRDRAVRRGRRRPDRVEESKKGTHRSLSIVLVNARLSRFPSPRRVEVLTGPRFLHLLPSPFASPERVASSRGAGKRARNRDGGGEGGRWERREARECAQPSQSDSALSPCPRSPRLN